MKNRRFPFISSIVAILCVVGLFFGHTTDDVVPTYPESEQEQVTDQLASEEYMSSDTEHPLANDTPQIEPPAVEAEMLPEEAPSSAIPQEESSDSGVSTSAPIDPLPPVEVEIPETVVETPESTPPENSTFSIRFLDVGQADSALVECDGHYALIDGGNKDDSSLLYTILKKADIKHLDYIWATHCHEDHLGGIPGALNYATADYVFCPETSYDSDAFSDFKKYADKNGNGIVVPNVGDSYWLGSAEIKVLGVNSASDTNNTSIVLKIQYGETAFLFTGDAEREAEQAILASGADLFSTVLKVGHHGSDTSTTYPFLREIMPSHAVISVGEDNSYGHPTEAVLSRLRDADVKVFRTDLQGEIRCVSDGKAVTFSVERNEDADTLSPAIVAKPDPAPIITLTPDGTPTPNPEPTPQPEEPVGSDYVLNTNTKKFHHPSCNSVNQMKDKNKAFFNGHRDEVIALGYAPCGNCRP